MSLWEYKVITSGKGGFATPALLETYLNQLGTEEWEIVEFRTQPDNFLAFSGLARRPTQRDWTLEAAAAAAARAEADKLRAEFAAKFQAATNPNQSTPLSKEEEAKVNRDEGFRRPRDTDSDQDPYALDDSAEEAEEIPPEDQLPTFFEAVRPHMRRNQKGPGHSVGIDYLVKKFEMLEDDLMAALLEIGFALPDDEDDKPVYVEYDGDIYWLNVNRRGEVWINTREKPRPVFKTVKATRLTPEDPQSADQSEAQESQHPGEEREPREGREGRESRDQRRNENRARRQEQQRAQQQQQSTEAPAAEAEANAGAAPVETEGSAEGAEAQVAEKPQREQAPAAPLPTGLDLLEKVRPMMRRSRGGWSGTISYLARALRHSEADLVAAMGTIGLVVAQGQGEKAPLVECGPFAYWLNKDGRGGIWINAREARRMRHEQKAASEVDTPVADQAATVPSAEAPEGMVPGETHPVDAATPLHSGDPLPAEPASVADASVAAEQANIAAASALIAVASPVAAVTADAEIPPQVSTKDEPPLPASSVDDAPAEVKIDAVEAEEPAVQLDPPPASLPLAGMRLLLKEFRAGTFAGELCYLAEQISRSPEDVLGILVAAGLKAPEKPRERAVYVEHAGEVFWLNRNAKGELWLNAKASKFSRKDEDDDAGDEDDESTEGEAGAEEKKVRRPRTRRKE